MQNFFPTDLGEDVIAKTHAQSVIDNPDYPADVEGMFDFELTVLGISCLVIGLFHSRIHFFKTRMG